MDSVKSDYQKLDPKHIFLLILFLVIQACGGTQIGSKLSESFDSPVSQDAASEAVKKPVAKVSESSKRSAKKNIKTPFSSKEDRKEIKDLVLTNRSFKPQPYRITIKLSGANPSAPAETVTNALRRSGVIFEVERIERVETDRSTKVTPLRGIQR